MAEHHSLCVSGRAGGIDDCSKVVRQGTDHPSVAGVGRIVPYDDVHLFNVDDQDQFVKAFLADFSEEPLGYEHRLALRVGQYVRYFNL